MDGTYDAEVGEPLGWKAQRAAALSLAWISAWWLVMIPVALMAFCLLGLAHRVQTVLRPEDRVATNERLPWVGEQG